MEVRLIERDTDVDEMWPKAASWQLENLVGTDVNLSKGIPLSVEEVRGALPTLTRLNYHVFMRSAGDKAVGAIVINHKGFTFGRGQEQQQLDQYQAALKEAEAVVDKYSKTADLHRGKVETLRQRMNENRAGVDLAEVKAKVEEWPEIIDFSYGPGVDKVTEQYLDSGTFVVTMIPVLFPGRERGYNDGWTPSTPIRFFVTEAGKVSAYGDDVKRTATHHPHIQAGGMCHGNMLQAMQGPIDQNNIVAAVDIMREWRIANAGHDLSADWSTKAYQWWDYWTKPQRGEETVRRDNPNHPWRFDGKWDGRTVQVSDVGKKFTTLEDYYGADIESIMHVMSLLGGNYRMYPTVKMIQEYAAGPKANVKGTCNWCQGEKAGCACHGQTCKACRLTEGTCSCPPKMDKPTVTVFENNNITYTHTLYGAAHRGRASREGGGYVCEVTDEAYNRCRVRSYDKTVWHRTAARAPRFVCQDHLNKAATAAYEAALKQETERFNTAEATK